MKIASSINQYFDDEGRPLVNGRVTFYDHDSDIQAEIFYLVGDEYTAAPNPQITADDGRIPTVFFEASVKDVKVEKQLPDGTYALLDTFEIGFDYPKAANATLAYGIDALKNTDPAVGIVQVVGYYSEFDAPTRWYVWDKNCSLDSDGGVIIESDVGEEGRWILLWDDELLPSSVYGIIPNENEANIAGFLSYPDYVGTFQIRTPPIPRFMSGAYTTVGYLQTTKALYFDEDAYFTDAEIHCDRAIIPANSHYVADFYFTGKDVEAHSSWFKGIEAFWRCTADKFIIDKTNYFANTQIKLSLELNGKIIEGCNRLPATYVNSSYITINNCVINGEEIFSPIYDYLQFRNMTFDEVWFNNHNYNNYDFGLLGQGHRIDLRTIMVNKIQADKFTSTYIYWMACLANGDTSFDGANGTITLNNVINNQFTSISNVTFNHSVNDYVCTNWYNVKVAGDIAFNGADRAVSMEKTEFTLYGNSDRVTSLRLANGCVVRASAYKWDPAKTAIYASDSTFRAGIELNATDSAAYKKHKDVQFTRCLLDPRGYNWYVNKIKMEDCTSNAHIHLMPYTENSEYHSYCWFRGNTFIEGSLIEIGVKDPSTEANVHGVHGDFTFLNNVFNCEDSRGITMLWQTRDYNNIPYLGLSTSTYHNNVGNCPREHTRNVAMWSDNMTRTWGSGNSALHYLSEYYDERVWNVNPSTYWTYSYGICWEPRGESWHVNNLTDARTYQDLVLHLSWTRPLDEYNDQFLISHCWQDMDEWHTGYAMWIGGGAGW